MFVIIKFFMSGADALDGCEQILFTLHLAMTQMATNKAEIANKQPASNWRKQQLIEYELNIYSCVLCDDWRRHILHKYATLRLSDI